MTEKVMAAIERYNMLSKGEKVGVALSGGADSVALLLCLKELGYGVFAIHVNHNLRGEEALRDQLFCEELCSRQGIELYVKSVDVKKYCADKKCSLELGARELRYKALFECSGGAKIATAHTLSDSLETALFNFTRGSGTKGLLGIPAVRGNIIRPLIECSRAEIEAYLKCKGQNFVTDSTNLEPDCSRNIIRLNVIPELRKINPNIENAFKNVTLAVSEADGYLKKAVDGYLEKSSDNVFDFTESAEPAVIFGAITEMLRRENIEPSRERAEQISEILAKDGRINIKKGVYLRSRGGKLSFEYDISACPFEKTVTLRENASLGRKRLVVTKISPFDVRRFNKRELRYLIDESRIGDEYIARNFLGREKIRLPERGFTSTVKKLLANLPPEKRRECIVIADGEGAVFVEGVGVSERVCCGSDTVSALKIDIISEEGDGI